MNSKITKLSSINVELLRQRISIKKNTQGKTRFCPDHHESNIDSGEKEEVSHSWRDCLGSLAMERYREPQRAFYVRAFYKNNDLDSHVRRLQKEKISILPSMDTVYVEAAINDKSGDESNDKCNAKFFPIDVCL